MMAGRGLFHEEYHSSDFSQRGGTFEMCQLWVNLPKQHKMAPPRYQLILFKTIPTVNLSDITLDYGESTADEGGDNRNRKNPVPFDTVKHQPRRIRPSF